MAGFFGEDDDGKPVEAEEQKGERDVLAALDEILLEDMPGMSPAPCRCPAVPQPAHTLARARGVGPMAGPRLVTFTRKWRRRKFKAACQMEQDFHDFAMTRRGIKEGIGLIAYRKHQNTCLLTTFSALRYYSEYARTEHRAQEEAVLQVLLEEPEDVEVFEFGFVLPASADGVDWLDGYDPWEPKDVYAEEVLAEGYGRGDSLREHKDARPEYIFPRNARGGRCRTEEQQRAVAQKRVVLAPDSVVCFMSLMILLCTSSMLLFITYPRHLQTFFKFSDIQQLAASVERWAPSF